MAENRPAMKYGNRVSWDKNRQIILRTQSVCGICGQPVDFSYRYPHPLSPTVDHIIPLAKGGHPYSLDNLQLAHRYCNRQKSDKIFKVELRKEYMEKTAQANLVIDNDNLPQHFDWSSF